MKVFLAYKFNGEDINKLNEIMPKLCGHIKRLGHDYFCSLDKEEFFKQKGFNQAEILKYVFDELKKSDHLIVFVKSENVSQGMLLEIGYALAHEKKITLLIKKGLSQRYLRDLADEIIEFDDFKEFNFKF